MRRKKKKKIVRINKYFNFFYADDKHNDKVWQLSSYKQHL